MNITRMLNRIKDGETDNTLDNNNGMYQYMPTPTEIVKVSLICVTFFML